MDKKFIDAKDTLKAFKESVREMESDIYYPSSLGIPEEDIEDIINDIPAADVQEVRHGKWEIDCNGYYPYCSNCKEEPDSGVMSDYCPNCGARMDGEENG